MTTYLKLLRLAKTKRLLKLYFCDVKFESNTPNQELAIIKLGDITIKTMLCSEE